MEMWGIRQSLMYRLLVAIKGQHDPTVASWTRSILIASSPSSSHIFDSGLLNPLWFDKPLLAMPLLDALALYLAASKFNFTSSNRGTNNNNTTKTNTSTNNTTTTTTNNSNNSNIESNSISMIGHDLAMTLQLSTRHADSSAVKWICIAYLIQCFVGEIHNLENKKVSSEEFEENEVLPSWDIVPIFRLIYDTVINTKNDLNGEKSIWKTQFHLSNSSIESLFKRILLKWIVFVRVAIRMTKRCDIDLFNSLKWSDDSINIELLNENITNEIIMSTLESFRLKEIFTLTNLQNVSIISITVKWLHDLFKNNVEFNDSCYEDCIKYNNWHYPIHTIPSFVELPNAYTILHGQLTSRCSYEYPAFCFMCGEILDAGNS